jgi:uncharacterized membrane protein
MWRRTGWPAATDIEDDWRRATQAFQKWGVSQEISGCAILPSAALQNFHLVLTGSADEMRADLLSIGATTLATAGVVFTLLTIPLSTVASQYGSRLLRVFLGDRTTQLVLGMFVGTFAYCLAAATSIPPVGVQPKPAQVTTTVGLLLMTATFATLILLVQHVSTMLQAPNIAAAAGAKLVEVVGTELPDAVTSGNDGNGSFGTRPDSQELPDTSEIISRGIETDGYALGVRKTGYIQYIDPDTMLALAKEKNLVIRLRRKPGHFVRRGEVVALIWPAVQVDEQLEGKILTTFRIGNSRTPTQDIEYAVNQLVEMAVRAMSPAINDPFTAMTCMDYIAIGLALFIQQREKGSHYYDIKGQLRLVFEPVTFEELLNATFEMLRHASCDNASVLLHMLKAIDVIGQETKPPEARQMLARQVSLIQAESQASRLIEDDRQLLQQRGEALVMKLSGAG